MGITYSKSSKKQAIFGYINSDFVDDKTNGKSTSGYVFILSGGAIIWSSKKKNIVLNSSEEAEYVALNAAIREALWLRGLMQSVIKVGKHEPTLIYADNTGAEGFAEKESFLDCSKHIDVKYHCNKEKVLDGIVVLRYIRTDENVGDVMTKKLGNKKHKNFVKGMGLKREMGRIGPNRSSGGVLKDSNLDNGTGCGNL